jgi:HEAT repeat protein
VSVAIPQEVQGVVEAVLACLADEDDSVVEAACFALGERGLVAGRIAVGALSQVATNHRDPLCREAAVAALGAIGDRGGVAAILTAMNDKPAVRRRAVLALAPFGGPDVEAALRQATTDRDWQVRQAAVDLVGTDPAGGRR